MTFEQMKCLSKAEKVGLTCMVARGDISKIATEGFALAQTEEGNIWCLGTESPREQLVFDKDFELLEGAGESESELRRRLV